MDTSEDDSEIFKLERANELRFYVHTPGQKIVLQLLEGAAELFGSQLHVNKQYEFAYFSSVTVFTWCGCTLKVAKSSKRIKCKVHTSEEVPKMKELHEYLESLRINAETSNGYCPITLIIGPSDVGKSTLCRYLLNYASALGRTPIFIDLDVGQSSISIPGTFGVLPVYEPSDANGKFNERTLSVYYFGYKSPGHNMMLYKMLLEKIGRRLKGRLMHESSNTKTSGVIIDTCGWVDGQGYKLIIEIIRALKVNVIFVVGDNSLYSKLFDDLSSRTKITPVFELNVSHRNKTVRYDYRNSCAYEYFYGSTRLLQPYTIKVQFSDLQIYKAKSTLRNQSRYSNVVSVPIEPSILNQILGLSYAERIEDILLTSVYGFVCLIELDMDSEVASLLSPQPGPLPTKHLVMGDMVLEMES